MNFNQRTGSVPLILIPLDYFLSARICPVKVAKHPEQGKTLTGQILAEID